MKFLCIFKKELRLYFGSFIAYSLATAFLVLTGYFFYTDMIFYDLFGDFLCSRPTVDRSYLTHSENDAASLVFHTIAIVPLRPDRLTLDT